METDVCRRFNPLMLNPFKLPNLLHTNNNYVALLLMGATALVSGR